MAETILQQTLGIPAEKLHDRRIGDLLDALHPHLDNLWKELVHAAMDVFGVRLDFVHYDITSLYFEGAYEDADLLEHGYSRDHRSDCKQVNVGLNISGDDGLPLAYRVLEGSTADRTTPQENMTSLQELLGHLPASEEIILVTDQAMLDKGEEGQLQRSFQRDQQQEALAQERDGRYLLATNRSLSADPMLTHFKEQDKIEKRNQLLKGPIRIRPMFLHKQERIESLVFICRVALLVFSILEMLAKRSGIDKTAVAILEQFQTLAVVITHFHDGSQSSQLVPLTPFQILFLGSVGMPTPEIYLQPIKLE